MAKCEQCSKEYEAKRSTSKYCSAQCRKLAFQENGKVSVPAVSVPGYEIIEGEQVFCRQAVKYNLSQGWNVRPEPLSPEDKPKPNNRGKYIRPDGSEYQFDVSGEVFECTLVDGKSLVYPTMADLKQAQEARGFVTNR